MWSQKTGKKLPSTTTERRFVSSAVLLDPNEVVSPYGDFRSGAGMARHKDPVQAVHEALQSATFNLLPGRPAAELLDTTVMRALPSGDFVSSAKF